MELAAEALREPVFVRCDQRSHEDSRSRNDAAIFKLVAGEAVVLDDKAKNVTCFDRDVPGFELASLVRAELVGVLEEDEVV